MYTKVVVVFTLCTLGLAQDDKAPRFSIGLGVLAPSYSQKLGGNGRLDVDQTKDGFSYSLNNVVHPNAGAGSQSSPSYQAQSSPQHFQSASSDNTGSDYSQQQAPPSQAQFSIYHHRQIPKQSSASATHRPQTDNEYNEPEQQSNFQQERPQPQSPQQSYQPPFASRDNRDDSESSQPANRESYDNEGPDYSSEPKNSGNEWENSDKANQESSSGAQSDNKRPSFGAYDFGGNIQHQFQPQAFAAQPFQTQPQSFAQSQPKQYASPQQFSLQPFNSPQQFSSSQYSPSQQYAPSQQSSSSQQFSPFSQYSPFQQFSPQSQNSPQPVQSQAIQSRVIPARYLQQSAYKPSMLYTMNV